MSHKLEDIEKKNIHKLPDGYFDQLPQVIQSRVANRKTVMDRPWTVPTLKWALASITLLVAGYLVLFSDKDTPTPEQLLSEVETEYLIDYLAMSDITTDEIVEGLDFNEIEVVFDNSPTDLFDSPDLRDLENFLDDDFEINEL